MHLRAPKPHRRRDRPPHIGIYCWSGAPLPKLTMQLAQAHTALRPAATQQRNLAAARVQQQASGALRCSQVIAIAPSKWAAAAQCLLLRQPAGAFPDHLWFSFCRFWARRWPLAAHAALQRLVGRLAWQVCKAMAFMLESVQGGPVKTSSACKRGRDLGLCARARCRRRLHQPNWHWPCPRGSCRSRGRGCRGRQAHHPGG